MAKDSRLWTCGRQFESARDYMNRQTAKRAATVEKWKAGYISNFEWMTKKELLEKRQMYRKVKRIAEGNKNELLVHHCDDMLKEINKNLKKRFRL